MQSNLTRLGIVAAVVAAIALLLHAVKPAASDDHRITVAVASNFARTAEALTVKFKRHTGYDVALLRGSSGKIFAQIVNGAPIDIFLSADTVRPAELEARGLVTAGSRMTYAIGALVVWSRQSQYEDSDCIDAMMAADAGHIAIANPAHAPYGMAAQQFLQREQSWPVLRQRLVLGENVSQAMQFAASGNADFGIIAKAQLETAGLPAASCVSAVPASRYDSIRQDAVMLTQSASRPGVVEFMRFLKSEAARDIIVKSGYRTL